MAGLPVANPLWRHVDERFTWLERRPVVRERPGIARQDAGQHVFRWEGAAGVMSRPEQVAHDDAHGVTRLSRMTLGQCCRRRGQRYKRASLLLSAQRSI